MKYTIAEWRKYYVEKRIKELEAELSGLKDELAGYNEIDIPDSDISIKELELSKRVYNSLARYGYKNIIDILGALNYGPDRLLAVRNLGKKGLDEIVHQLSVKGYL